MPKFKLRFERTDLPYWSTRYQFKEGNNSPYETGREARQDGFLTREGLYKICTWKSPRKAKLVLENSELTVNEITRFSFSTDDEVSRISSLTLLKGVQWPTASVILHFCVDDSYPILDVRAIWSLGEDKPARYDYDYWKHYVDTCRNLAKQNGLSVRELDKALWQYAKENQPVQDIRAE